MSERDTTLRLRRAKETGELHLIIAAVVNTKHGRRIGLTNMMGRIDDATVAEFDGPWTIGVYSSQWDASEGVEEFSERLGIPVAGEDDAVLGVDTGYEG